MPVGRADVDAAMGDGGRVPSRLVRRSVTRLGEFLHRAEITVGVYRPNRSPWVWLGPGLNVVATAAAVLWAGVTFGLGWLISVPLALFCGLGMGGMAVAFFGNWEADEDEDDSVRYGPPPPAAPPGR